MNSSKSNKSQISIFIVIVGILLLLVLFLVLSSNSQRENTRNNLEEQSTQTTFNIYDFYESSQSCLELSTKKAILLLSVRGGVIYPNENTQQFAGGLNSLNLNSDYVRNLDLEMSTLQEFMLPSLSSQNFISYTTKKNITTDMEHYIIRNFVKCQSEALNTTNLRNLSYSNIDPATVTTLPSGNYSYEVDHLKAEDNDSIQIYTQKGEILIGKYNSSQQRIIINKSFNSNENIVGIINDSFNVEANIERELISSKIATTDSFESSTNQIDRGDIEFEIETPFYSLFQDLQTLMNEKMFNRSISFNNSQEISKFRLNNNLKLKTQNIENNNEEIFQVLVLSINEPAKNYEFDSIVGIYKNTLPKIEEDEFQIYTSSNVNLAQNSTFLEDKINHEEYEDNFLHQNRFEPYQDSDVKLYPNGSLEIFTNNGFFSKQFYVTDGELSTPFTVNFNLGGDLNEENSQFDNCFDITYDLGSLDSGYDEFNYFLSNSMRELNLKSVRPATNFEWYGVVSIGTNTSNSVQVTIDQNPDCFDTNDFDKTLPHTFTLSQTNPYETVTIENYNSDGSLNGEPFEVNIGAVDCLGPRRIPTQAGAGTCCDIFNFEENLWDSASDVSDFNSIFSNNFILNETIGFEFDEMYMCPQTPRAFDFSHWEDTSFLKTQELKTTTQVICQGNSPILEDNDATTSGSMSVGDFTPLDYPTNNVEVNFEPSGNFYDVCQECEVLEQDESFVLTGDLGDLSIGTEVKSQNAQDGIYLEQNQTIRRLQGGTCYDVYQERECQNGAPSWVDKSQTSVTLDTYVEEDTNSDGCSIDRTYRENCLGDGYELISTSAPYDCPPPEEDE